MRYSVVLFYDAAKQTEQREQEADHGYAEWCREE